jgi:large subunit ribosomal protein L5
MATTKALTPKEIYFKEIVPHLSKDMKAKNLLALPRLQKVIVNVGIGKMMAGGKDSSLFVENIKAITGQHPVVAKAKKSISNFKLREKMPVGVYATLRGNRMYDFIYKLVNIVLPRVRDFRGLSPRSFDGKGNYSMAILEHNVFPEINADDMNKLHGLQITIVTSAKDNDSAFKLLKALGFPFQEKKEKKEKILN